MRGDLAAGRSDGYRWFVVGTLSIVYTFNFLDRQLMSILQESIRAELHLTDTQLGMVTGLAFALVYTTVGIPVAWLADRTNRVRIITAACAIWSLASAACGLATGFPSLALARLGVGFGEAGGSPPAFSLIADYFPAHRRGGALAVYALGVPLGTMVGSGLGAAIDKAYGWRAAFFAVGAPGVLLALFVLAVVREPVRESAAAPGPSPPLSRTLALFVRDPVMMLTALAAGLSAFAGYGTLNWAPSFLIRVKHMHRDELALYYSLMAGSTGALGTYMSGWLIDRLRGLSPRAYALVPLAAYVASAPFFALFVWAPTWPLSLACLAVPALLMNMYLAPALTVIQNRAPADQRSAASAILLFILNLIGLGGGPVFVGRMADILKPAYGERSLQMALYALVPFILLTALGHYASSRAIARHPEGLSDRAAAA